MLIKAFSNAGWGRAQQEIKTEGEEIKERIGKLAQSVKEVCPRMYILGTQTFFLPFHVESLRNH